uniref:Cyclin-like domain-containing protein n=1 Tax=Aplanochytrium stocchinoi TaxID=215587 RepID=A0A7S3V0P4_9STRA
MKRKSELEDNAAQAKAKAPFESTQESTDVALNLDNWRNEAEGIAHIACLHVGNSNQTSGASNKTQDQATKQSKTAIQKEEASIPKARCKHTEDGSKDEHETEVVTMVNVVDEVSAKEMVEFMRNKEQKQREAITSAMRSRANPLYTHFRRSLVDWVSMVGTEENGLHQTTIHTAVSYMDAFLYSLAIDKSKLQLVALCCLKISAKLEERDGDVPSIERLLKKVDFLYSESAVKDMEFFVLKRLGWSLSVVTTAHFLEILISMGTVFKTDCGKKDGIDNDAIAIGSEGKYSIQTMTAYVNKFSRLFVDLALQHPQFLSYRPSCLASVAIAGMRNVYECIHRFQFYQY